MPDTVSHSAPSTLIPVYWAQEIVGYITQDTEQHIQFSYDRSWLSHGAAISQAIPLRAGIHTQAAHHFFGNLLPEADFRKRIETLFQVSSDNDYSLLMAIGGDCAGALSIGYPTATDTGYYQTISDTALQQLISTSGISGLKQEGDVRLSLAGAQGKLPVSYQEGILKLPCNGAVSTHILKFNSITGEYARLVENEYLMNRLAAHLELPVINCQLHYHHQQGFLICERYDRQQQDVGHYTRLHQEDFCQALNYSYRTKYEKEGGPSLIQCGELVRQLSLQDLKSFIDWLLFNFLASNADAHAKNISINYANPQQPQLAPFYDLVCTRAYTKLSRHMAMAIGGEHDPDLVSAEHLQQLAAALNITPRFFKDRFTRMIDGFTAAFDHALEDLGQFNVTEDQIQHITLPLLKFFNKRRALISSAV